MQDLYSIGEHAMDISRTPGKHIGCPRGGYWRFFSYEQRDTNGHPTGKTVSGYSCTGCMSNSGVTVK